MKKIALLLLLGCCILTLNAQERTNGLTVSLSDTISTFNRAQGWFYSTSLGEWIEHDKMISKTKEAFENIDNFKSLEFRKITGNGKEYLLLIKNIERGAYKYATIQKNWDSHIYKQGYILDINEFKTAIGNLNADAGIISIKILGRINPLQVEGNDGLLKSIKFSIQEEVARDLETNPYRSTELEKQYTTKNLIINFKKEPNNVIRFIICEESCYDKASENKYLFRDSKGLSKKFIKEKTSLPIEYTYANGFTYSIGSEDGIIEALKNKNTDIFKIMYYETNATDFKRFLVSPFN